MIPTYYVQLRGDGFQAPDLAGRHCADAIAARAGAERLTVELATLSRGAIRPGATLEVGNPHSKPLLVLPLREGRAHRC